MSDHHHGLPAAGSREAQPAIEAVAVSKCYEMFDGPLHRLRRMLWPQRFKASKTFWALNELDFTVQPGEVIGLVGRNGAGKSTLLHLVCGTVQPSSGSLRVNGRVAALLELGSGFNPEFTGRENVYMNAGILGLRRAEVDAQLDDILAFADIGEFIDQPVKTYSSGMFMRLAFAVATSVDPDILVIDEALAVGDGAFARRSFRRIMDLRDAGKTILFCSHSLYQVEALCNRALWLDSGRIREAGDTVSVTKAYAAFLSDATHAEEDSQQPFNPTQPERSVASSTGRIVRATCSVNGGPESEEVVVVSNESDVTITMDFAIDPELPPPSAAIGITNSSGLTVASAGSHNDGVVLSRDASGRGRVKIRLPKLQLLKGFYYVTCFLASEDALQIYDQAVHCLKLDVCQRGLEQGIVALPHDWIA